ncbi:acyltransferase [Pseudoalteromonas mariniglutinosa]|uniref:acyltransferase n=1 Tax=Pseudoalteromonas mariniglutinosa TaxID=206042 RepID=UPI00384FBDE0
MSVIRCFLSIIFYTLNTLLWSIPIFICGLIKLLPIKPLRKLMSWTAKQCATIWVACNSLNQNIFTPYQLNVTGLDTLQTKGWYLVIANHQSWVDILVMQRIFNRRMPFLNFFLKKELIYVPFLGLSWWALDFPFMTRTSKSQLKKNPKLRGKDLETTRKACEKFKEMPVSIVNFVEGTRFTKQKQQQQSSPFGYLLKPKAGGVAFVMQAMGEQISKVVNVTIHYPDGIPSFIDFASGRVKHINVHIETMDVSPKLVGDYMNDTDFRINFQAELNRLWIEKDQQLESFASQQKEL